MEINKEHFKDIVSLIFRQAGILYANTVNERKRLNAEEFRNKEVSFSPLFEIEMLSELISGYAYTVTKYGKIYQEPNTVIVELNNNDIFNNEYFLQWFLENENNYPNICSYVLMLDYLRIKLDVFVKSQS